jgi:hypothetical protein
LCRPTYKTCTKVVYVSTITKTALVETFVFMCDNTDNVACRSGESHKRTMVTNYLTIHLQLMLVSPYKLKHLKQTGHEKFFIQLNKQTIWTVLPWAASFQALIHVQGDFCTCSSNEQALLAPSLPMCQS